MEDIAHRCNCIKEGLEEYDCRKMPVCKTTVAEYVEAMTALAETQQDISQLQKSFTDWLGNHLRSILDDDAKIWINKAGNSVLLTSDNFSEDIFNELSRLELTYNTTTLENGIVQIMVVLWVK